MVSSWHLFGHVFILICILHVLPWLTWCVLLGKVTTNSDRKQNLNQKSKVLLGRGSATEITCPVWHQDHCGTCLWVLVAKLGDLLHGESMLLCRNHPSRDIVHPQDQPFVVLTTDTLPKTSQCSLEPGLTLGSKSTGHLLLNSSKGLKVDQSFAASCAVFGQTSYDRNRPHAH